MRVNTAERKKGSSYPRSVWIAATLVNLSIAAALVFHSMRESEESLPQRALSAVSRSYSIRHAEGHAGFIYARGNTKNTWKSAEAKCNAAYHSTLATVNTWEKFNLAVGLKSGDNAFVGAVLRKGSSKSDGKNKNYWGWRSGPMLAETWAKNQPDQGSKNSFCGSMSTSKKKNNYGLHDLPCNNGEKRGFLCDRLPEFELWAMHGSDAPITWKQANAKCSHWYGTQLATFPSHAVGNRVLQEFGKSQVMIGLRRASDAPKEEVSFRWESGVPRTDELPWDGGRPNSQDCSVFVLDEGIRDVGCDTTSVGNKFVCDLFTAETAGDTVVLDWYNRGRKEYDRAGQERRNYGHSRSTCELFGLGTAQLSSDKRVSDWKSLDQGLALALSVAAQPNSYQWSDGKMIDSSENLCYDTKSSVSSKCLATTGDCWYFADCSARAEGVVCQSLAILDHVYIRNLHAYQLSHSVDAESAAGWCESNDMYLADVGNAESWAALWESVAAESDAEYAWTGLHCANDDDGELSCTLDDGSTLAVDASVMTENVDGVATEGTYQFRGSDSKLVRRSHVTPMVFCQARRVLALNPVNWASASDRDQGLLEYSEQYESMQTRHGVINVYELMSWNSGPLLYGRPLKGASENEGKLWAVMVDRDLKGFSEDTAPLDSRDWKPMKLEVSVTPGKAVCFSNLEEWKELSTGLTRVISSGEPYIYLTGSTNGCASNSFIYLKVQEFVECRQQPLQLMATGVAGHIVTINSCGMVGAATDPKSLSFMITGELSDGTFVSTSRFFLTNDRLITLPELLRASFSVLTRQEMADVLSVTVMNDGTDDFCLGSVEVDGVKSRSVSAQWLIGRGRTSDRCQVKPDDRGMVECPRMSVASFKFAACGMEVIAVRPIVGSMTRIPGEESTVTGLGCRNENRFGEQTCQVNQDISTTSTVVQGFDFTTETSKSASFSLSTSATVKTEHRAYTEIKANIMGAEANIGKEATLTAELTAIAEAGGEWAEKKSSSKYSEIQKIVNHAVHCHAEVTLPALSEISTTLTYQVEGNVIRTESDVRLELCRHEGDTERVYHYVYDIPGTTTVKGAHSCQVQFTKPKVVPNKLSCYEELQMNMNSGAEFLPRCQKDQPAKYEKCQCWDVDKDAEKVCFCVDESGNTLNTGEGQIVTESTTATCAAMAC